MLTSNSGVLKSETEAIKRLVLQDYLSEIILKTFDRRTLTGLASVARCSLVIKGF